MWPVQATREACTLLWATLRLLQWDKLPGLRRALEDMAADDVNIQSEFSRLRHHHDHNNQGMDYQDSSRDTANDHDHENNDRNNIRINNKKQPPI